MQTPSVIVHNPAGPEALVIVRTLFEEYAASLSVDLCFQNFREELAELPGEYAPPRGALLLALVDGVPAGCCALRPIDSTDYPNAAEMKRLFVRKAFRSFGLGRQLSEGILDAARQAGYTSVLLDTLTTWNRRVRFTTNWASWRFLRITTTPSRVRITSRRTSYSEKSQRLIEHFSASIAYQA